MGWQCPLLPTLDGDATRDTAVPFLRERAALSISSVATGCDWARFSLCLACGEGPSLVKCQMEGCSRTLHHMCQTEWESAAEGREAHGSKKLCAYHHPFLTNHPSCSTSTLHKAAFPSAGASALMTVPRYDKAKYPGVEGHGVYLQMVVNGVHLQHKRGAKGKIWKDFYEQTVGIRTG